MVKNKSKKHIAIISKSEYIIPIIFEERLDPGRYAIEIDEFTNELYLLERGTIKDNTFMYYCKRLENYNGYVYLYTLNPCINERVKFDINKLLRNEMQRRKDLCQNYLYQLQ